MCYNEKNNSIVPVVELDTIKASDAFGPGSSPGGHTKKTDFIRLFLCVSAAVRSSTEGTPSGCRLTLKVAGSPDARRNACPKNHSDDAAHKALCRSIPGGHTKKTDFIRLFLCVSAAVRSSTEGTPSGCRLTLKVAGSPDARRNARPKIIPTMRRTRLYAEVSPLKKQSPSLSFFILQCLKKKLYAATAYTM